MYKEELKAHEHLQSFFDDMVERRLEKYQNEKPGKLIIDQIISHQDKFTASEMKSNFMDQTGPHDLLATNISNAILILAIHPEIQEKIFQELNKFLPENYDVMDKEMMAKCEYLDMFFKENLRLFPVVPIILREALEDFDLETDISIPEGISFLMNFYALHRNKKYWGENAEKFIPERFSAENSVDRHPCTFLPFSTGTRICLAYKYSAEAFKIILARLVRKFKFTTNLTMESLEFRVLFTLKLCGPHLVTIVKRN